MGFVDRRCSPGRRANAPAESVDRFDPPSLRIQVCSVSRSRSKGELEGDQGIDSVKPIVPATSVVLSLPLPRLRGEDGVWGRPSGTADLSAASSAEASAKAEASGGGVCGFPPPQPSPARAGEGAQRRKRRYDTDLGNAGLVRCTVTRGFTTSLRRPKCFGWHCCRPDVPNLRILRPRRER